MSKAFGFKKNNRREKYYDDDSGFKKSSTKVESGNEEEERKELSCWKITESDGEVRILWLLQNGNFKQKNVLTEDNKGAFYDTTSDTWNIEGDKVTISFTNGFRIMKGYINSEKTLMGGTWANNHGNSGTWSGEKISPDLYTKQWQRDEILK